MTSSNFHRARQQRPFWTSTASCYENMSDYKLLTLGCNPTDIGTHSLRKRSSAYAPGQVGGPHPVSVYLRMAQSPGKVKDPNFHSSEGAAQLCGRMLAGLPFDSKESECCRLISRHNFAAR